VAKKGHMRPPCGYNHLILNDEIRVYWRELFNHWQAAFIVNRHTIHISTRKPDLTEDKM
jgi:hypothetical protein